MNRYLQATLNTAFDTGVLFGGGNTWLNWDAAGPMGIAFNLAATAVCATLRFRAELAKDRDVSRPESVWDSPATALCAAGIAQYGVAIKASINALSGSATWKDALIPFLFGNGNKLAALKFKLFVQSVKRLFRLSRIDEKPFSAMPEVKDHKVKKSNLVTMAKTAAMLPQPQWVAGLIVAGGIDTAAAPLFLGGGVLSVIQAFRAGKGAANSKISAILDNPYVPTLTLALGCLVSSLVNSDVPSVSGANVFYGAAYAGLCLTMKFGGTIEAVRALPRSLGLRKHTPV